MFIDANASFYATQVNKTTYVVRRADLNQEILAIVQDESYGFRVILNAKQHDILCHSWEQAMDTIEAAA